MDLFDFIKEEPIEGQKHWLCFTTLDNIVYYKVLYIDNIVESSNRKEVLYRKIYVPVLRERFKSNDPLSVVYDAVEAIRVYVKGITKIEHSNTFITLAWKGETNKEIGGLS
jgi:hypothetical protein